MRTTAILATIVSAGLLVLAIGCKRKPAQTATPTTAPANVLRHVVLFKFKDGTTPEQIKAVEDAFCALPGKISAIADFEWGTDVSPEKRSEGFTHCFFVTFRTEADRDAYLPHPAHKEFGGVLRPHLDKVLVVDYWAKR
jgi:hypothetical protein